MKRDPEIMQHADDELTGDARGEVEELLAGDDGARAKHEAIAELGDLVRGHLELSADAVPQARFDAMWRAVDRAIDSSTAAVPVAVGDSWLRRKSRWLDQRLKNGWGVMLDDLAAALYTLLALAVVARLTGVAATIAIH